MSEATLGDEMCKIQSATPSTYFLLPLTIPPLRSATDPPQRALNQRRSGGIASAFNALTNSSSG